MFVLGKFKHTIHLAIRTRYVQRQYSLVRHGCWLSYRRCICHVTTTRASLMLAATMACVLSIDSEVVSLMMGEGYNINIKSSPSGEDLVWQVRCLLQVGVAGDSLKDTLMLLNAIVPNEL